MHTLKTTLFLPITVEEAWDFFSNPSNLKTITPSHMGFDILSDVPEKVYEGLIIKYKVKPLLGIPMKWMTEIAEVKEPSYFVDNQLSGPYKVWHHRHEFKAVEGGVEMNDEVNYVLPLGFIGRFMHTIFIKKEVEKIFIHRKKVLEEMFPVK
jgi:ligand-binding SRPBCC domain-containing protein